MSARNPFFVDVDGAPYEIPDLLKHLGDVKSSTLLDQDRLYMVDAIHTHARNAEEWLLDGIRSIGHLMELAGCGDLDVDNRHVAQLGTLIKHLAGEADSLRATHSDMGYILAEQKELQAKANAAHRRAGKGAAA